MEYKSGDFCKAIGCLFNEEREKGNKEFCKLKCKAYQFHKWLKNNKYKIIKDQT